MQILVAKNKQQTGPFSEEQILQMVSSGMLSPTDLAWHDELAGWLPLNQIVSLGTATPQNPGVPPQFPSDAAPAATEGPKGVGGWLLLFCVGITILAPLSSLLGSLGLWTNVEPAFAQFPSLNGAMILFVGGTVAVTIYGVVAGTIIWSGSSKGKSVAKMYLIITLVAPVVVGCLALTLMTGGHAPQEAFHAVFNHTSGTAFWSAIANLIWWLYFQKSKRVRNTYG